MNTIEIISLDTFVIDVTQDGNSAIEINNITPATIELAVAVIGAKGLTGDKGDKGETGAQGIQGIQGLKGDAGAQGIQGIAGANGSVWRTGSGAPSNTLGADGDYYLNSVTSDVYLRASGIYSIVANIQGQVGATGSTGAKGDKGDTGATGSQGIQGVKGDKGDTGATGATGAQGIQGIQGLKGDAGATGATGAAGAGLAVGGTTGQVAQKKSNTDYDTQWVSLASVAFSGLYSDLSGAPTKLSQFTNDSGYITSAALAGYATQSYVTSQGYAVLASLATVATTGSYNDLGNKPTYLAPRLISNTSSSSITINADITDQYNVTGLAVGTTFNAPSGSPIGGQKLTIRIKDNGTPQTIAWNAIFRVIGTTLFTTTVANKTFYVGCIYNAVDTTWDVVSVAQQV